MNEAQLDDKIRHLLSEVMAGAPASPPFPRQATDVSPSYLAPGQERHRVSRGVRWVLGTAAVVLVVVVGVVLWTRGSEDSAPPAGPVITGDGIPVVHETWEYTQAADLTCPDGLTTSEGFSSSTFEVWTDEQVGRLRHDIVYPDESSRSVLQLRTNDMPPDAPKWSGDPRGQVVGCRGVTNFLTEPGISYPEVLTSPINPTTGPAASGPGLQQVGGETTDSLGRRAELWRQNGGGYIESIGPMAQQLDYFIDPVTGLLLERRFTNEISGFGTIVQQFTRTAREETVIDAGFLSPDGFSDSRTPDTVPSSQFEEQGTCARGGTATVCLIRDGQQVRAVGAGLEPGSSVQVTLRYGNIGLSSGAMDISIAGVPVQTRRGVAVRDDGTLDSDIAELDPSATYVIAGVAAVAADDYPLNSSLGLSR